MITYHLELTSRSQLIEKSKPPGIQVSECKIKIFQFNRFLYEVVGSSWEWKDKATWSDQQWQEYVDDKNLRTWVAYVSGAPAGYFELQKQESNVVEIAYFGLIPRFIGKGFGSYLLSKAIRSAFEMDAERVWVHTCSRDHPSALGNYQARGMKIFKVENSG